MAIDTNNEKFSLITYHQPWNTPIPSSSDGIGQDDKQHLLWEYPGILWTSVTTEMGVEIMKGDLILELDTGIYMEI